MTPDRLRPTQELEPLPQLRKIFFGAGQGTGSIIARRFAREGHFGYIGTRKPNKFTTVEDYIYEEGGTPPLPFLADITKPEELQRAYETSGIQDGEPIDVFLIAAAGFEKLKRLLLRPLKPVREEVEQGKTCITTLERATAEIREIALTEAAMKLAMDTNYQGVVNVLQLLEEHGNLQPGLTTVETFPSSISLATNPHDLSNYKGPNMYLPIGISKQLGDEYADEVARRLGLKRRKVASSEIGDTEVGGFFDESILPLIAAYTRQPLKISKVSRVDVAETCYLDYMNTNPSLAQNRTVYATPNGPVYERPTEWDTEHIPYL